MPYTYHVVPFAPSIRDGAPESMVSGQLAAIIQAQASSGYELVQVVSVPTVVTPGCLAFLSQSRTVFSTQLIFKKPN